jgi:uncharacterized protein (DUF983 family)
MHNTGKHSNRHYLEITDRCVFCGEDNQSVLHQHHIIPRRFNGGEKDNLLTLCANCHELIEKIYDNEFFQEVAKQFDQCEYCGQVVPEYEEHVFNADGGHGGKGRWPDDWNRAD